jgi:RNA polymerase sigma-70 factor, ECF subfamily
MSSRCARDTFANKAWWFPRQVGDLSLEEGQALVDEARAGSRQAQEKLLTSFWPKMLCYFAKEISERLRAKIGPEDLAQRACLLAWQHFDKFRGDFAEYCGWIAKICRNLLKAVLRHYKPGSDHDISREELLNAAALEAVQQHGYRRQKAPEEIAEDLEITAALETAIEQLPPDERQLIHWRVFEKLKFAEIAARLGRSADAVRRAFNKALQRLAETRVCQTIA